MTSDIKNADIKEALKALGLDDIANLDSQLFDALARQAKTLAPSIVGHLSGVSSEEDKASAVCDTLQGGQANRAAMAIQSEVGNTDVKVAVSRSLARDASRST